eukprot:gene10029-7006_t
MRTSEERTSWVSRGIHVVFSSLIMEEPESSAALLHFSASTSHHECVPPGLYARIRHTLSLSFPSLFAYPNSLPLSTTLWSLRLQPLLSTSAFLVLLAQPFFFLQYFPHPMPRAVSHPDPLYIVVDASLQPVLVATLGGTTEDDDPPKELTQPMPLGAGTAHPSRDDVPMLEREQGVRVDPGLGAADSEDQWNDADFEQLFTASQQVGLFGGSRSAEPAQRTPPEQVRRKRSRSDAAIQNGGGLTPIPSQLTNRSGATEVESKLKWIVHRVQNAVSQSVLLYFLGKSKGVAPQHPQLCLFMTPEQVRALLPPYRGTNLSSPAGTQSLPPCTGSVGPYLDAVFAAATQQLEAISPPATESGKRAVFPLTVHLFVAPGVQLKSTAGSIPLRATATRTTALFGAVTGWALLQRQHGQPLHGWQARVGTLAELSSAQAAAQALKALAGTMAKRRKEAGAVANVHATTTRSGPDTREDEWVERAFHDVRPRSVKKKAMGSDYHALYASMLAEVTSLSHRRVVGVMSAYPSLCRLLVELHEAQQGRAGAADPQAPPPLSRTVTEFLDPNLEGPQMRREVWNTDLMQALLTPYQHPDSSHAAADACSGKLLATFTRLHFFPPVCVPVFLPPGPCCSSVRLDRLSYRRRETPTRNNISSRQNRQQKKQEIAATYTDTEEEEQALDTASLPAVDTHQLLECLRVAVSVAVHGVRLALCSFSLDVWCILLGLLLVFYSRYFMATIMVADALRMLLLGDAVGWMGSRQAALQGRVWTNSATTYTPSAAGGASAATVIAHGFGRALWGATAVTSSSPMLEAVSAGISPSNRAPPSPRAATTTPPPSPVPLSGLSVHTGSLPAALGGNALQHRDPNLLLSHRVFDAVESLRGSVSDKRDTLLRHRQQGDPVAGLGPLAAALPKWATSSPAAAVGADGAISPGSVGALLGAGSFSPNGASSVAGLTLLASVTAGMTMRWKVGQCVSIACGVSEFLTDMVPARQAFPKLYEGLDPHSLAGTVLEHLYFIVAFVLSAILLTYVSLVYTVLSGSKLVVLSMLRTAARNEYLPPEMCEDVLRERRTAATADDLEEEQGPPALFSSLETRVLIALLAFLGLVSQLHSYYSGMPLLLAPLLLPIQIFDRVVQFTVMKISISSTGTTHCSTMCHH